MPDSASTATSPPAVLDMDGLQALVDELQRRWYVVLGPTVRDDAIRLDEIGSVAELPIGWGDEQDAGHYRLRRRDDGAAFGYAVGPDSPKTVLFPPRRKLWQAERDAMLVTEEPVREQRTAFLGVRACELTAVAVLHRVFLGGAVTDPAYASGRHASFFVAVACGDPGGTCFCADMDAGPAPRDGFDLVHTELLGGAHRFVVQAGSAAGADVLVPPYRWLFDARAVEPTLAICLDGKCLRDRCEADPRLGYQLMSRVALVMTRRLAAARVRLLDLYGHQGLGEHSGPVH